MTGTDPAASARLAELMRDEWGRLLALLVARFRRLDLAEDGLADAFEAAARTWPTDGVPSNGVAWLLTAARRRVLDRLRSERVLARSMPLLEVEAGLAARAQRVMADAGEPLTDERLRLVLLCAHPRLSPEAAAALTLRLVLGVPTADVARLFLRSTPTMAARLTRARKKLAGETFALPRGPELDERLAVAADVAYLAFTAGYAPASGDHVVRGELAGEAVRLVRVLRETRPALGVVAADDLDALLALVLLQHSRRDARVRDGALVLLPDQDRSRWHQDEIAEALELLAPLAAAPPTPYLLQALVAAEHAIARSPGATAWDRILARYDELLTLADTPVVRLNRAVAVAEVSGPRAGLDALAEVALPGHRLPAVRAELLRRAGDDDGARRAYDAALALCTNGAEHEHLRRRRAQLA
ncbi:RNA polymerase subunit sigma-24 [Isoptericola sp. 4D.3]|uniref:RNA polymerase subunit sigma-24 n=1 Tax=Isoptericola peretonis TaxID=2918523 RepID=A0ABT0IYN9_9MICO|nr:RNA polymerase subunit sigma-24 [Isoptericola sp. 4D.3]